jgi:uncharacterized protein (DUF2236 family)
MHAPGEKEPYTQSQCITWQVAGEAINGLGTSRAVLLQLAHPLVAAGVYEHSSYFSDPIGRACRTFTLGQFLTFGNSTQARQAAHTINKLHHHVHGTLKSDAGSFAQGTRYNAHDPELLLWVYATLIDTVLVTYPLFVQPLSEEQQEQYYQESKQLARLVGIPPQYLPETVTQLRQYMYEMIYSERLAATPEGRALAQVVLYPPLHSALRPFMHLNQYITSALLPEPVRQIFDLRWSRKRQQIFDLATTTMRTIIPHLPIALRMLPLTRSLLNEQISTHAS